VATSFRLASAIEILQPRGDSDVIGSLADHGSDVAISSGTNPIRHRSAHRPEGTRAVKGSASTASLSPRPRVQLLRIRGCFGRITTIRRKCLARPRLLVVA